MKHGRLARKRRGAVNRNVARAGQCDILSRPSPSLPCLGSAGLPLFGGVDFDSVAA